MAKPNFHDTGAVAHRFKRSERTIRDWIRHGCPTPDGLIRMEAAKVGKRWLMVVSLEVV